MKFCVVAIVHAGILIIIIHPPTFAMGNHPEAGVCSLENPYQAICTHSLHNLEGWYGPCYTSKQRAQQDADAHANEQHNGNSRYTGIKKIRIDSPPGY